MIRIAVLGDIGSGKSYVARQFGYPVFSADEEVNKLYRNDRTYYNKLKKGALIIHYLDLQAMRARLFCNTTRFKK